MDLSSTLSHAGWTIRYKLFEPVTPAAGGIQLRQTVVFVHGTAWSSIVFWPLTKALLATNKYRVLLYDLPGYGQSQECDAKAANNLKGFDGDTSVRGQAAALNDLLRHLQLDGRNGQPPPHVVAHDIAGTIVLRTLLIHQAEYKSLLLMDTNTVLPWGDGFYKLTRSEPDVFLKLPSSVFESVVRGVIQSACYDTKKLIPHWEDDLAEPWIPSNATDKTGPSKQSSFVRQIAQANDADVAEMLDQNLYGKVKCPVKIMWGEQDAWIPREKMDRLAEMLKHCLKEFVVVPEAGHLLMIDQPERVTLETFKWLEENN